MAEQYKTTGSLAVMEKQRVIVIEAADRPEDIRVRVAAYVRVSSGSKDQLNSFAAQNHYYTSLISGKENWVLVDVYADHGITGTSAEKRDDFQRLLSDCRRGLIDRVLCKSISRFARNTTECLETIRELKSLGIWITFEKEHIDTAKVTGEMLTALFAAMAQAESESISRNGRLGVQMRMKNGTFVPPTQPYGYRRSGKEITIYPPEAQQVRRIFEEYLSGYNAREIASRLNRERCADLPRVWNFKAIVKILRNEKYAGNSIWQKSYHTETLPRKERRNHGEQDKYFATDTHPPIITQEMYDRAQELLATRKEKYFSQREINVLPTPGVIYCGYCGVHTRRKTINGKSDSEMLITILGAFAQAESESISGNVVWGIRQAMREGKVAYQYSRWYGYQKGEDGKPEIIPEQAEVVRQIYDRYLAGASLRQIKDGLESQNILNVDGEPEWTLSTIKGILTNEKYCGDALLQKTFIQDCISKKVIRNTGQLPQYLIQNCHQGIVSRQIYDSVQAEMARRNAGKSPSKKNAPTGRTSYTSRYALSERLVCGECGTLYRRCVWAKNGRKRIVWRCVSRLDYGTKYCHNSPTLDEEPLQRAILAAINASMGSRDEMTGQITEAMELELAPIPGQTVSLADIQRRLGELEGQFNRLLEQAAEQMEVQDYMAQFQSITNEIAALKEQRAQVEDQRKSSAAAVQKMTTTISLMEKMSPALIEWDESWIRQLVDTVKVLSEDTIMVYLRGGIEIRQSIKK